MFELILAVMVGGFGYYCHLNRRRYVMQGGKIICPLCRNEITRKAKRLKVSVGLIVRTPLLDDYPCELCNRK